MTDEIEIKYCQKCYANTIHAKKRFISIPNAFIWSCMVCGNDFTDDEGNEPAELIKSPSGGGGMAS